MSLKEKQQPTRKGTLIYSRLISALSVVGLGVLSIVGGVTIGGLWFVAGGLGLVGLGVVGLKWRTVECSQNLKENEQGAVWWGTVAFGDGSGVKDRPVVEVGRYTTSTGETMLVCFGLTSQSKRAQQKGYLKVDARGWDRSGKHKKSFVNVIRIEEMYLNAVRRKGGYLSKQDTKRVLQKWLVMRNRFEKQKRFNLQ